MDSMLLRFQAMIIDLKHLQICGWYVEMLFFISNNMFEIILPNINNTNY